LANKGFNIIVDSFITLKEDFKNYKNAFENFSPIFIYLHASEKIISQREKERGDRLKGSAIHWLKKFDFQSDCDFIINTDDTSIPLVCEIIFNKISPNQ
jgi:chloramphenicol 3-O-phosphotransferase